LETLNTVWTIAKVAVGLGFVIFMHELGHFLLAKWNGVKVEKFSIGFGPTLFGFRRGETEYVVAALPLGGFVKMLGEGAEEQEKTTDPRAYPNKSVGARMAIISAGVIMNVLLALFCFSYKYTKERIEIPAVLGAVSAGSLAYEVDLRPGDEIVAIDGDAEPGFQDLKRKILFSADGQVLRVQVKRPGHEGLISCDIEPRRDPTNDAPAIGIAPAYSLEVADFDPPAGMENPPAFTKLKGKERETKVDVLVAAGPAGEKPVALTSVVDYDRLLDQVGDRPITHVIERRRLLPSGDQGDLLERFELVTPPNHHVDFGLRLDIEPINGIRRNSPADKAGFRKGDRIVKVNGSADVDPLRLPEECYKSAGKAMTFDVERDDGNGGRKTHTLSVTPDDTPPRASPATYGLPVLPGEAVDLAGLGVCYPVRTRVLAVRPDSPAARAGLAPGDVINALTIPPKAKSEPTGFWAWISRFWTWISRKLSWSKRGETFEFKDPSPGWYAVFMELQTRPLQDIELTVNNASRPRRLTPEVNREWPYSWRGLQFIYRTRKLPPQNLAMAVQSGYEETVQTIAMTYATFRSLAQRRVGTKNLGGPIMIAQVAYTAAGMGWTELIYFLGFLSINLAVLNFLPIPPLDGGQMLFLIAEKVRGRPLPDSAVIVGSYLGLLLVLCLMVFVTYQDIFRLVVG
jgi:regulator of sigma E protease